MGRRNTRQSQKKEPEPPQEEKEFPQNKRSREDEEPPQISSDSSSASDSDDSVNEASTQQQQGMSRMFAPYRTLGLVATAPFSFISHQTTAMLCLPIGERFQLMQTDRLNPVLVSRAVPNIRRRQRRLEDSTIQYTVPDATLRITVVGHATTHVTLYQRTVPLVTRSVVTKASSNSKDWKMRGMLHMGRIKMAMHGEKEGKQENAAVIAVVLAKTTDDAMDSTSDRVPVVGSDGDDDSVDSEDHSDSDNDSDSDDQPAGDCRGQVVILIATRTTLQIHRRIHLTALPDFVPATAMHPDTYVNKMVLAGHDTQGKPAMCLLNFRSSKIIHNFTMPLGEEPCCITTLEQSPAIDTIAVGSDNGMVHLVNLRHDKKLFSLKHAGLDGKPVAIASISFRNDASAMKYGIAPMAVGRSDGTITVWDLTPPEDKNSGRTILCNMDRVHDGGISKLQYMPQEPVLVSTGTKSNAVLMHIFDNPDHSGRLLRQRKGHTAPPSSIKYLNASGGVMANSLDGTDASSCQILSSGGADRTLRVFSSARSVLDKEYSQGAGLEKRARDLGLSSKADLLLPPTTDMALCQARKRDWGDLVTIHEHSSFAYVWSTKRGAQSGPILRQKTWNVSKMKVPPPAETHATSVAISACGNFALVGTRGGVIYKYNLQSGIARGSYPTAEAKEAKGRRQVGDVTRTMKALEKKLGAGPSRASNIDKRDIDIETQAKRDERLRAKLQLASHSGFAVSGLAVDSVNKTLISVGTDAKLILWKFDTHTPHKKSPYQLPSPAKLLRHVRESDLAAIALEDFSVILFDCTALSIVRRFGSGTARHTGPISDLAFSPDGRNLFTSSLDGTIRVWDVPTNTCIDWLGFKAPPTSLAVSPTGEFLATTHVGKVGISMWSDRSYYQRVQTDGLALKEPVWMDDPSPMSENYESLPSTETVIEAAAKHSNEDSEDNNDLKVPITAKEDGLVTLSGLPPAHWKNLFHLELVKERNKPTEAPKKPPSAPFFLQWRSGEKMTEPAEEGEKDKATAGEDEWAAAWSDDEGGDAEVVNPPPPSPLSTSKNEADTAPAKRRKVTHHRSRLVTLLEKCSQTASNGRRFQEVSDYIAGLGPSAIDVEMSTLCNGLHDLEDGLPFLLMASHWLLEACDSRERYEAVNAYLHRFLYLHGSIIAGMGDSQEEKESNANHPQRQELLIAISRLRKVQQEASDTLQSKMQHSLCLLRHFSRMT